MTADESPPPPPAPVRRRLEDPAAQKSEGRSGCLILGAVLGILIGGTFAFYGLPPILRHFYGEQHIAAGQAYNGDGKTLAVAMLRPADNAKTTLGPGDIVHVFVTITSNTTWEPTADNFQLELTTGGTWLKPLPPVPAVLETSLLMPIGEQRTLILRYKLPDTGAGQPKFLHIGAPRVRFALPPLTTN